MGLTVCLEQACPAPGSCRHGQAVLGTCAPAPAHWLGRQSWHTPVSAGTCADPIAACTSRQPQEACGCHEPLNAGGLLDVQEHPATGIMEELRNTMCAIFRYSTIYDDAVVYEEMLHCAASEGRPERSSRAISTTLQPLPWAPLPGALRSRLPPQPECVARPPSAEPP